jgi:hypothetical protein
MTRIKIKSIIGSAIMLIIFSIGSNLVIGQPIVKQGPSVPTNFCIGSGEMELYRMINDYRKRYGLAPIPLSKSLSYVAALHAKDLFLHHPDQGSCNFHSWSDKGFWKPFCYPKDETKKSSVWDKPRELTKYPSKAYEIVYWENNPLVLDTIIMVWKTEEYFNSFLLNSGKWQGKTWNAIGIAVYENYACAWFGDISDPEDDAIVCGSKPVKPQQDTLKPPVKPVVKPPVKPKKLKTPKTTVKQSDSLAVKPADTLQIFSVDSLKGKPKTAVMPVDSTTGIYYIIVKTNVSAAAAKKLVGTLASEYPAARVLEKDGKIRVSVFESSDKASVMATLKEVKKKYKDAWLLKR